MIVSEPTVRLAGRLGGLQYSDRGRVRLKGIPDPIHIYQVYSELDARPSNRWVLMFFGKPGHALGWRLGLAVVALAAVTAAGVVYLTSGERGDQGAASPPPPGESTLPTTTEPEVLAADAGLDAIVPASDWTDCRLQTVPEPTALQTAVCLPANGNAFFWGGERQWLHGAGEAGRARLLLLRRQRRGDRLVAHASRTADAPRHPRHRSRERKRPRGPHQLVAPVAPPGRQGAVIEAWAAKPGSPRRR